MTSRRSKSDLGLCVICGNKKVSVSGRTEYGKKLITNLLSCLSLVQLKSKGEKLEHINFCFKCKHDVDKWTYAQGKAVSSVFFANRARQTQASVLVKILESTRKSSASSASSLVETIQWTIYDRFNVAVNVDRLELSREQMDQISEQELINPENHSNDLEESEASKVQDDLQDASSTEGSLSHAHIWQGKSDEEFVEVLPKKLRTSISTKIDYNNGKCQLIASRKSNVSYNLTKQAGLTDKKAGPADVDPVEQFQKNHPLPPDFIPKKYKLGSFLYGKCSVQEYDNKVECCKCSLSIPMQTDGVSSWWKIREHMRNEHPELVPCLLPMRELALRYINQDKYMYGQVTMTKFSVEDVECYMCDACGEFFRSKFARKHCMGHILRRHPQLTGFNRYYRETPIVVNKHRIRYAGAYLKKLTDTKVICLVCSFVSTGSHALNSSCSHVREHHPTLAPAEISAVFQTNSKAVQSINTVNMDESATSLPVSSVSLPDQDEILVKCEDEEEFDAQFVEQAV